MTITQKLLIIITLLAGLLRFIGLSQLPPSLNLDEVAIGYNAYSILKTGMDEFGTRFPVAFRSHDDYKAPLYIYLTTIPILVFGLSDLAIRFSSALFGTLAIPFLYLFLSQLPLKKTFQHLPLISVFLLAINPWHIQISRMALETNVATTFILIAMWAFYQGLSKPKYWLISAGFFIASLYTYHSTKLFLPPLFVFLAWQHRQPLTQHLKLISAISITSFILLLPLLLFSLTPAGQLRFMGTSVFAQTPNYITQNQDQLIDVWRLGHPIEAKLFHNRYLSGLMLFLTGYSTHFSFSFLFGGEYGPPVHQAPNIGLFYLWQIPFLYIGIYAAYKKNLPFKNLLLTWLLLVPIGSAMTWDAPSSNRTTLMIVPLTIFISLGVIHLYQKTQKKLIYTLSLLLIVTFFFTSFLHNYIRLTPQLYADMWQYGYNQAVDYTDSHKNSYDQIIVSTNLRQPQNFWAYYTKYDPHTYIHQDGGTVSGGFNEQKNHFNKFYFHQITSEDISSNSSTLFVDLYQNTPSDATLLQTINLPNQEPYLAIFTNQP